ncbi:hypothetical protein P6166_06800 [Stenotrophomonas sp. HITSZ_GD]|uniref:hypothetical protein n=1 Tax=Stenotrophomonas sp. HITSZ_GD TaxID=3037248 RepID=UPI00240E286A|nr:hypothetical protein [Stenotrophomonas sp. HITSZ_GD]MDG2525061.1 hypothetical protein [Stenotrophomonas sp. HITSZ_GD]
MPAQTLSPLMPYLTAAGMGLLYYRRMRRYFGRQPWQPKRTLARVVLLVIVTAMLVLLACVVPHVAWGMAGGAVAGVALGLFALHHTRIELDNGVASYTPNPWIGGVLGVLLIGRLAWRWSQGAFSSGFGQTTQQASPLTLAIAAALVLYSLTQGVGLMWRMRALHATPR